MIRERRDLTGNRASEASVQRHEGFSAANAAPTLAGIVLVVMWSVWLLATAWGKGRES